MTYSGRGNLEGLLAQQRGMRLLDCLLAHEDQQTRCGLAVADSHLFVEQEGRVPAWVALEYMAQCVAVHGALAGREGGAPAELGVLAGCRRLELSTPSFDLRDRLEVVARVRGRQGRALAFDCEVRPTGGGEPFAAGRLQVALLDRSQVVGATAAAAAAEKGTR